MDNQEKIIMDKLTQEGIEGDIETLFKAQPPYMEVEAGYGYLGVMLLNKVTDKVQCHVCGEWFKNLGWHVHSHNLTARQYKEKFSLFYYTPLCGRSVSRQRSNNYKTHPKNKTFIERLKRMNAEGKMGGGYVKKKNPEYYKRGGNNSGQRTMAFLNSKGFCERQMLSRYLIVAGIVGNTSPSHRQLFKYDRPLYQKIVRQYGNVGNFKKKYGYALLKWGARKYTEEYILADIIKFAKENGRVPRSRDFTGNRRGNKVSKETIRKHFGSWNRALTLAGFERFPNEDNRTRKRKHLTTTFLPDIIQVGKVE